MTNRIIPPVLVLFCLIALQSCKGQASRPNIILILTDQQSESMMSSSGNPYLHTPAMDYIANNGIRFTRAYVTNPVCSPSRVSLMTGRFPGYFKDSKGNLVRDNASSMDIPATSREASGENLASYLKKAGYDLVYGGKQHLPAFLDPDLGGFHVLTEDARGELASKAADYIRGDHENPYFMTVSLINPHDICFMAIRDFADSLYLQQLQRNFKTELTNLDKALELPEGVSREEFFEKYCPPLPPNFEPQEDEAKAIELFLNRDPRSFRSGAREEYTEEQWRMHRWAYARLTEMVDVHVQEILDALIESGKEEETLVIFTSEHGDNDGSHRLEHKNVLYEESVKVPFTAMWKRQIPAGQVNDRQLVSVGLDVLPTLADYAGIAAVTDPRGSSLRPLFEGEKVDWRESLGIEGEISRAVILEDGLKYIRYDAAGFEERLMDLKEDPYETTHFTYDSAYRDRLQKIRREFEDNWFPDL
ncbi:sulfatase family protein [Cyclobacterium jeungdonense]|uniref:Sulfatase-like hydrolase/transferase n=1 Tax=Cyclobacterium jeungdonense TaxID=708087 RepID=A0ABT8C3T8_9BACT|nr:sulfatase-like hydrolase/transferase [Cyclobacterium jeungdonense]MDN3687424.1 sulfatase-like hydrolase/transferase [Cyclobacterium jeungdonense]